MAQNNNHAGIVHARDGYCDIMVRGNQALSNRQPEVAIKYYTKILYKLSPGDVCALLNRSIAYVCEGYFELAVTDAYRASLAARAINHRTEVANTRLDHIVKYIDAERLHARAKDPWTRREKRNVGDDWLAAPLASVVLSALPGITPLVKRSQQSAPARAWLSRCIEIRAVYRLCGALSILGEGARMDALELIDNIKSKFKMAEWEALCFDNLGNDIMSQLAAEVDPGEPEDIIALGHDSKAARDERMRDLKRTMRARTSSRCYGDYPWDRYEPKLWEPKWASRVQSWVEAHSQNCSAMIIQPEEAADTLDDLKPYVELRAKRDINPGEIILSVLSMINLTTSIPEQVQARRHAGSTNQYHCNSCASLLVVPREYTKKFEKRILPSTGANLTGNSEPQSSVPSTLAPPSPPDFMFCHPTHMVPTCSAACRGLGRDFDHGICHTNIEQELRQGHFNDIYARCITDRNTQCLRDLIFVRLIAIALNLRKNILGINDIMFATSGPDMRDIGYEEVEPWSFTSHVVRPLGYLDDLFQKTDTDQFERLAQVDGWMLNTLLVKINRVMNVSQTPRYVKYFRPDGMLVTAFGPDDDRWTHVPREPEDQSTWIASIDSLVSLIGIADPAKGETPNVTIVRREGVHVYAATAIKAGEPLLRAGNGAESPTAEEAEEIAMLAKGSEALEQIYEMEKQKERQSRMNESGDTKEPQDHTDEMDTAAEDDSETKVDIEQYFEALDVDRRNAKESQDQRDEQGTDAQESQDQSIEMNGTDEEHSIDIEQYFDDLDEEGRMDGSSDGEEGTLGSEEDVELVLEGEGAGEEGGDDAMVVDEMADRYGDGVRVGHDVLRGE